MNLASLRSRFVALVGSICFLLLIVLSATTACLGNGAYSPAYVHGGPRGKNFAATRSTGRKSTTHFGRSSSGRKTNAFGEKLGPSGRPMRYSRMHSTRKAAKDAARREGKGAPIQHNQHFHPADAAGNKMHNKTHHRFPR